MLFSGARTMVAEFATMTLLLFFLLRSGDLFLRRLVEILPTLSDKKQAVDISREIARNISGYLVTITLMNGAVGVRPASQPTCSGFRTRFCGAFSLLS